MALQKQQDLLARLYTDNDFRSKFLTEPGLYADDVGLSPLDAEALAAAAGDEVRWFADSLVNKRLREVENLLPLTAQELGSTEFDQRFRNFASDFSPTSVKKHLEDALAFSDTLTRDMSLDGVTRDVVRFESRRLRHNAHGRRISYCLLRHDPRRTNGSGTSASRSGVGFWVAVGRWSRIFFR